MNVPAGSSSGVVGGLMTGEQYQFSVSVAVAVGGGTYTGPVSIQTDFFTAAPSTLGKWLLCLTHHTQPIIM